MRSRLTHEIHRNEDTLDILERVDVMRMDAARKLDTRKRAVLGQYFTPAPIARQMASLFEPAMDDQEIYMLDAGAGVGILFVATVIELLHRASPPKAIHLVAYEIDDVLVEYAYESLRLCQQLCRRAGVHCSGEVLHEDFVASATEALEGTLFSSYVMPTFTHVILNPPYHKIASTSPITNQLHRVGIDTTNLYTGFLALATRLLTFSGQLVAITPRSFCNGPYFKNFRQEFLKEMMLRHIHVFESRQGTFEDDVLQESVILHAIKENSGKNPRVIISSSTTSNDDLILSREVAYEQVLHPHDPESFIHIVPDTAGDQVVESMSRLHTSLEELEIAVSTGRVVDFRAAAFLRRFPGPETVPLIYPTHIENSRVRWPKETKKPNALVHTEEIQTLLVPNGSYVLVKRFSAKEEKRRIVAALYDANDIATTYVGFENHLNYFHAYGKGLPLLFAKGLVMFLNSTLVDAYFRHFNGHTQVNATDLRNIHYPTQDQLERLGAKVATQFPEQAILDELVERELFGMSDRHEEIREWRSDLLAVKRRIEEALAILKELGLPRRQQNERSALTLLALLNLKPDTLWGQVDNPLCGITPMMDFFAKYYGKTYEPNTRETVRRQTIHQFLDAGLVIENPDNATRPPNSPKYVYQIERSALELLRSYGTQEWDQNLQAYLSSRETLRQRYAQEREMRRIPIQVAEGKTILLSPGGQNVLIEHIINEFAPRFTPAARVLYVGDTDNKFAYFDEEGFAALGITIEAHGKIPDVILYYEQENWLVLIEAVTSHGPIDAKRVGELEHLFANATAGLVYVTAFLSKKTMGQYLNDISWETDVWIAEAPSHLIHFDGERFLGPN